MSVPTRAEAERLLAWGHAQNPGPWAAHGENVARAAETIGKACGMDTDKAYALGLLHDIGYHTYRDGAGDTCHIFTGYTLMLEKGYTDAARICLTHSFSCKDIREYSGKDLTLNAEQYAFVRDYIAEMEYDDYDRLIQLCDCLGTAQGVVLMEKRLMGVLMRHGVYNEFTIRKWEAYFGLKRYFDEKSGMNLYRLFEDKIINDVFA
jgi:hypothetical protein